MICISGRVLASAIVFSGAAFVLPVHAAAIVVGTPPASARASAEVFFSPDAGTDQALASAIGEARQRVWVAGYFFTSSVIAKAIEAAHRRRVDVRVLLDSSQVTQRYSSATFFHNQGVPLWINARYPVMHHKLLLIDADTVGFGSMNFTRAGARQNAENFNLFRRWPQLADTYAREFLRLQAESEPYRPGMSFDRDRSAGEKAE